MTKLLKKINTKIVITAILGVVAMAAFTGCSGSKNTKSADEKNVSVSDINKNIAEAVDISKMIKCDDEMLKKLYDIDKDSIEEYVLYIAHSNLESNEIAVIKVKSEDDIKTIEDKISDRIDKQAEDFKGYLPEQYSLIEDKILKNEGKYILFVVSKDAEKIESAFNESLK